MPEATQLRRHHHEQVEAHDRGVSREDERILATVPNRTSPRRYAEDGPSPEAYRQALKAILATPEIESRLNYITASLVVTIFGGWLASKLILSRAFILIFDLILLTAILALAGLLIGIMLGESILPTGMVPVLLVAATGILLLISGFVLGRMIIPATSNSRKRRDEASLRRGVDFYPLERRR